MGGGYRQTTINLSRARPYTQLLARHRRLGSYFTTRICARAFERFFSFALLLKNDRHKHEIYFNDNAAAFAVAGEPPLFIAYARPCDVYRATADASIAPVH